MKKLKAATLPELLISLILSLTLIYLCISGFERLHKRSHRTSMVTTNRIERLEMVTLLKRDLLLSSNVCWFQNRLSIDIGKDSIIYFTASDTLHRQNNMLTSRAHMIDPKLQFHVGTDSLSGILTLLSGSSEERITDHFPFRYSLDSRIND